MIPFFFHSRILCVPGYRFLSLFNLNSIDAVISICKFNMVYEHEGSLNSGQFTYKNSTILLCIESVVKTCRKYFPKMYRIDSQISINFVLLTFYTVSSDTSVIVSSAFSYFYSFHHFQAQFNFSLEQYLN